MPKPSRDQGDEALAEALKNRIQGPPAPRAKPFGIGCALVVIFGFWTASTFIVAVAAAILSHRWGLS